MADDQAPPEPTPGPEGTTPDPKTLPNPSSSDGDVELGGDLRDDDGKTADQANEPAKDEADDATTALGAKEPVPGAAPETYDIKPPEGREFDKEAFDAVAPELKALGLPNEAAQKLVDAYAGKVLPLIEARYAKQAEESSQQATATLKADWLKEAKDDPEIGGGKWDETIHMAGAVFDKVGLEASNPFRVLLEDSGLGNHPDALRFMRRLGTMLGEDKFERGDGNPGTTDVPIWDKVYGVPAKSEA